MTQDSWDNLFQAQEREQQSLDRLHSQRESRLYDCLVSLGWYPEAAEHRIAMMIFHVTKNKGGLLNWTNQRIADDPYVQKSDGRALSPETVRKAIRNLRDAEVVVEQPAAAVGIRAPRNVKIRSIDFGRVYSGPSVPDSTRELTRENGGNQPGNFVGISWENGGNFVGESWENGGNSLGISWENHPDSYSSFNQDPNPSSSSTNQEGGDSKSLSRAAADPSDSDLKNDDPEDDLEPVCRLLKSKLNGQTVERLRDDGHLAGYTVDQIRQLIVELEHGLKLGLLKRNGALAIRIQHLDWPHDDVPTYQAIVDRQRAQRRVQEQKAAQQTADRQRALEAKSRAGSIESEFGPVLDAMSREQLGQLAARHLDEFNLQRFHRGGDYRWQLLEALQEESRASV